MDLVKLRRKSKRKKPAFRRQEHSKHPRLKDNWAKPRGKHSKLRMGEKARGKKPSTGFGSPKKVRGADRSGRLPVLIHGPSQLSERLKDNSVIIASTVGGRKRKEIKERAMQLGIKISNARSPLVAGRK